MTDNKQLTPQEKFMDKMSSRIRDDIGDLLPNDVLSELVQKNINELFLQDKKVRIPKSYGGFETKFEQSDFRKMIAEETSPLVAEVLKSYFEENQDAIKLLVESEIKKSAESIFSLAISSMLSGVVNKISDTASNAANMAILDHNNAHHNGKPY